MATYRRKQLDIEAWSVDELMQQAAADPATLPQAVKGAYESAENSA